MEAAQTATQVTFQFGRQRWTIDRNVYHDISIRQTFAADQPNHFGAPLATREPLRSGDFVGSVSSGGPCNVDRITLVPHCNGTHTESVHHILRDDQRCESPLPPPWITAVLLSVTPVRADQQKEGYQPALEPQDLVISRTALERSLSAQPIATALIVRSLPNPDSKRKTRYGADVTPPFFTTPAMQWIAAQFEHLVVDVPSVDRMFDQGLLSNHHLFWHVPLGATTANKDTRRHRTITEMVYVDDSIGDGDYLLNLQVVDWALDAVPSRLLLYPARIA